MSEGVHNDGMYFIAWLCLSMSEHCVVDAGRINYRCAAGGPSSLSPPSLAKEPLRAFGRDEICWQRSVKR